jgi:multiple sugar transport system ATP-binding protein
MRASLSQLHDRLNVTTVYVTHDQIEAMTLGDRVCVLRDGVLQQVDTPQNLFNHPVNLFVAGFIGSPAMNFTMARLERPDGAGPEAGEAVVSFAGYQLPLSADVIGSRPGLEEYFGHEVILGIRPSDFEDASLADPGWARMPVTASVTEELGSEILVMFLVDSPPVENSDTAALAADEDEDEAGIPLAEGKTLWTARASARSRIAGGSQVELGVDTSNLHFFDPESGLTIGSKGSADPAS